MTGLGRARARISNDRDRERTGRGRQPPHRGSGKQERGKIIRRVQRRGDVRGEERKEGRREVTEKEPANQGNEGHEKEEMIR